MCVHFYPRWWGLIMKTSQRQQNINFLTEVLSMLESIFIPICSPHYQTSEVHLRSFRDCSQKYSRTSQNLKLSANDRWCFADTLPILCQRFANASEIRNIGEWLVIVREIFAEHFLSTKHREWSGKIFNASIENVRPLPDASWCSPTSSTSSTILKNISDYSPKVRLYLPNIAC